MAMDIREQVNYTIQQTQGWIDWSKGRILNLLGVPRTQQDCLQKVVSPIRSRLRRLTQL